MKEALKMFDQTTFEDFATATSLPALADGLKLSDSPNGQKIVKFGQALVRANLSARQAKELGMLTSGIYGRPGSISSRSAGLQSSLVNKLMLRLSTAGSTCSL